MLVFRQEERKTQSIFKVFGHRRGIKMKKVCFITTISLTLRVFVLRMAQYLHENTDWDISFICDPDEYFSKDLPEYIHYYPVKMERGVSLSGIGAMLEMKKIFDREKFDMIQYSTPNASLYAALAGWLSGIPIRLYCQWGMVYIRFSGIKRCIFKTIEKIVCMLSTWVEPDSHSNLAFAHSEKLYPKTKGSVVWNGSACGVDLDKFDITKKSLLRDQIRKELGFREGQFLFGFVGRITKDKGVNELLSAFKELCSRHKDIGLIMVGPEESDATVEVDLLTWAEQTNQVVFTGYTDTVEAYLAATDVYILPSYREGFGMGVIEAEAMGVPVIVTNIPGPTDAMVEGKTGIIVEKGSVRMLLQAMEALYEDRHRVSMYGENACRYVQEAFEQKTLFSHILADRKKMLENRS